MAFLEFKDVSFRVGDVTIIDGISLEVDKGDFISIVGPSGSGKSTFIKLAADLISPTSGEMYFKGKNYLEYPPTELRKKIMMSFQSPYLFGDTVIENLKFPFEVRNEELDRDRICELLNEFKMSDDFLEKEVANLSGGEKQRIALIRSLVFEPEVLLLDEVTSALDVENTKIVESAIKRRNEDGMTIIWITHDPEQSKKYDNRLIEIDEGKLSKEEVIR